jgi:hypothetical protein
MHSGIHWSSSRLTAVPRARNLRASLSRCGLGKPKGIRKRVEAADALNWHRRRSTLCADSTTPANLGFSTCSSKAGRTLEARRFLPPVSRASEASIGFTRAGIPARPGSCGQASTSQPSPGGWATASQALRSTSTAMPSLPIKALAAAFDSYYRQVQAVYEQAPEVREDGSEIGSCDPAA